MDSKVAFLATLNTAPLDASIKKSTVTVNNWAKNIEHRSSGLEKAFTGVSYRLLAYGSIFAGLNLVKEIVRVRGEFQKLQVSFETMLDSKIKADQIMLESIDIAQKTPFTLMEVTANLKQLMAMGVEYKDVTSILKNLGDVAAGVNVPIQRIAINYGQVITLGRLQAREIRDFAMAGVPIVAELAKNLGKTKAEILGLVKAGRITGEDVTKAFQTMSSAGGKFYNLMEKQNASITGQLSNLVDKWQIMLNEIGKSNEGTIYSTIKGAKNLVENYESIGKILTELVVIYGLYRTASLAAGAIYKTQLYGTYALQAQQMQQLLTAEQLAVISKQNLVVGSIKHSIAVRNEVQSNLTLIASQKATADNAIMSMERTLAARRLQIAETKKSLVFAEAELISAKKSKDATLIKTAKTNQNTIAKSINYQQSKINILTNEIDLKVKERTIITQNLENLSLKVNSIQKNINAKSTNFLTAASIRLSAAMETVNKAILNNPWTAATVAILAFLYLIYKLTTATNDYQKSIKRLEKSKEEYNKDVTTESNTLAFLFGRLKAAKEGTEDYDKAKKAIQDRYGQYLENQTDEIKNLKNIAGAYNEISKAAIQAAKDRMILNVIEEESAVLAKRQGEVFIDIQNKLKREFGEEQGSLLAGQLKYFLETGTEYSEDVKKAISRFKRNVITQDELGRTTSMRTKNLINDLIDEYRLAKKDYNKVVKLAQEEFGQGIAPDEEIEDEKTILTIEQERLQILESIAEKRKEILRIQNEGVEEGKSPHEEIKKLKEEIDDLNELIGIDSKKNKDLLNKRLEYQQKIGLERVKNEIEIEELLVEAQKDGIEKQRNQTELEFKKDLVDIAERRQKMLDEINKSKDLKPSDKGYVTSLSEEDEQKIIDANTAAAIKYTNKLIQLNKDAAKEINYILTEQSNTLKLELEKQIGEVNIKYDKEKDRLIELAATKEQLQQNEINRQAVIDQVYIKSALKLNDFYQKVFSDISLMGDLTLGNLIDRLDQALSNSNQKEKNGKTIISIIDPNTRKEIELTTDEFWQLQKRVVALKKEMNERQPFRSMVDSFKKLKEALKGTELVFSLGEGVIQTGYFVKNAENISDAYSQLAKDVMANTSIIRSWGDELDAIFGEGIGEVVDNLMSLADGIVVVAKEAKKGLKNADIMASATGILSILASISKLVDGTARKEFERERSAELLSQLIELQNIKLEEQLRIQKGLSGIEREREETNYLLTIQDDLERINEQANNLDVIFKKVTKGFLGIGKNTTILNKGVTEGIEELRALINSLSTQELIDQGYTIENLNEVMDLIDQYDKLIEDKNKFLEERTQTSVNNIADMIADAFEEGKTSEEDFANNFEELMKNAIKESFKTQFLINASKKFFEMFSELSQGGLNAEEIIQLQGEWTSLQQNALSKWEEITKGMSDLNIDFGNVVDSERRGLQGAIRREMTEETAGELAGLFRKFSDDARNIRDYSKESLDNLILIERNTYNTVVELKNTVLELKEINKNTTQQTIRDLGV